MTRKKPDSVFLCDFCQEEYDTLEELERHQVGVHGTITFHRPNETSIKGRHIFYSNKKIRYIYAVLCLAK